jgi:hypothetical protein
MRWFRENVQLGSRLALLALAIQFVLSFSHVHLDGFTRAEASPAYATASGNDGRDVPQAPATNHDPFCAVCASIQLASTLICADAPALHVPAFSFIRPQAFLAQPIAAATCTQFNARAPPFA